MQGTALGTTSWLPCLPRQFCPQTVAPRIALMRKLARLNPGQAVPEAHGQVDVALPQELAGFRPNVGVCVVNSEGMVFAARRCDDTARTWQMPQGGIDAGESAVQAAVRELAEETNIRSIELLTEAPRWLHYEFPTAVRSRLHCSWSHYKGQAQRWFLFRFTGDESEINLDTDHKEFAEWCWMPLQQLPDTVVGFKREVYQAVVAEFAPIIQEEIIGSRDTEHYNNARFM